MNSTESVALTLVKSLEMLDGTTMELTFYDDITIDLEGLKAVDAYCQRLTAGRKHKRLVISGRNAEITSEARHYGEKLSLENKDNIIAEAIVVHSLPQKMIANFYFRFLNEAYPARFFTNINKAKEWLGKYGD